MDAERFDAIVGSFYEAAMDPRGWHDALFGVAQSHAADNFHLMVWDPSQPHPLYSLTWGMDPAVEAAYREHYGAIDPRRLLAAQLREGEWFACHRYFDDHAVSRSEFFQDFLIPGGVRYLIGGRVTRHAGFDVYFGMHRAPGRPAFSDTDAETMQRLTGHFQRAARLWLDSESLRQRAAIGEHALDSFGTGVIAIDAACRIRYANHCAEALLSGGPIGVRLGLLTAPAHDDAKRLRMALELSMTSRQASSLRVGQGGLRACSLTIVPLPATSLFAGLWRAELLVLATPTEARPQLAARQLMQLFDLTPAEARLARALAGGETVQGFASGAGLSVTTAKAQLRSIFVKMGVTRQSDLVRQLVVVPVADERPSHADDRLSGRVLR